MTIVLLITLFMIVMFLWNKIPFGVTTMTCCLLLAAFGVVDLNTAFTGFGNKIVVLIAPTLALSAALQRTSLVGRVAGSLNALKEKNGMALVLAFFAVGAVFSQFIPTTAALTILIIFLTQLDNTGDITANRLLLPLLGITCAWKFRLPIGLGASTFALLNGFSEGIVGDNPEYQVSLLDPFKFAIIPIIVLSLYCIFCWKLMPKDNFLDESKLKKQAEIELLPEGKQKIVYAVFVVVMLVMLLNQWTGNWLYLAPAAGVLVLIYTKCLDVKTAVHQMTADMIWMLAGVLIVADALGSSGAGEAIGNTILKILGDNPSQLMVMFVFSAATVIMTTFISNMGTQSVLIPIAASVALAAGWNPKGLILIIGTANYFALGFPSGSGEAAVAFAAGGYNPGKVLKFTGPYMILAILACTISAAIFYPL